MAPGNAAGTPRGTRFQADKKTVTGAGAICRSHLIAEVARGDAPERIADSRGNQPHLAMHLDSRWEGTCSQPDADPGVTPQGLAAVAHAPFCHELEAAVLRPGAGSRRDPLGLPAVRAYAAQKHGANNGTRNHVGSSALRGSLYRHDRAVLGPGGVDAPRPGTTPRRQAMTPGGASSWPLPGSHRRPRTRRAGTPSAAKPADESRLCAHPPWQIAPTPEVQPAAGAVSTACRPGRPSQLR